MDAHLEHLQKLTVTLRSNLEKCASDPGVDPVHDLRTGTRRVQALVEAMMRERGDAALAAMPGDDAVGDWLRMLKRLRRAAGPVRDLDVHRKLLLKLVKFDSRKTAAKQPNPESKGDAVAGSSPDVAGSSSAAAGLPPAVARPSLDILEAPAVVLTLTPEQQQADHLDAWLRHARQHQAAGLKKKAAKWLPKFDAEAAAFEAAVSQGKRTRSRARSAAVVALEAFAKLVHEMQQLDAGNLHDFRKGAKKARYIAESAAEDAHALAVGKAFKKLQDEIGDWHDWLVLADEARSALGEEGKELIALLDAERDKHFKLSMKTVDRMRGKLMGEWLATTQPRRRTPPANQQRAPIRKNLSS